MHPSGLSKRRARLHFSRTLGENTHINHLDDCDYDEIFYMAWLFTGVQCCRSSVCICLFFAFLQFCVPYIFSFYWFVRSNNTSLLSSLATNFSILCSLFLSPSFSLSLHSIALFLLYQMSIQYVAIASGCGYTIYMGTSSETQTQEMEGRRRKRMIVFQLQRMQADNAVCVLGRELESTSFMHLFAESAKH